VNLDEWNKLPKQYQEFLKSAAHEANTVMISRYEARNNQALASLIAGGTQLRAYSPEILEAAETAAFELYEEFSAADADFAAVYEGWRTFRDGVYAWNKTNQAAFEQFVYRNVQAVA
jgi:TRAP-type mannitol/chloroaromatic compound transport system substrate-binding protein